MSYPDPDPRAETLDERNERLSAELALWVRCAETFGHQEGKHR